MELDKITALIQAVSDSSLTGFILDEGNLHMEFQKMPIHEEQIGVGGQRNVVTLQSQDKVAAANGQAQTFVAQGGAGAGAASVTSGASVGLQETVTSGATVVAQETAKSGATVVSQEVGESGVTVTSQVAVESKAPIQTEVEGTPVCSPLVGTFYCAPSEGEPPFVKVGDRVTKGQVLGIIEAMKLMNEIECEKDGVVVAILVGNEQMVEYGQKLFMIQ